METQNNYEDYGLYYANQKMVKAQLALSINSGIIYDISDAKDIMRVSMLSQPDPFIFEAKADIDADKACWYGIACIMSDNDKLIWEY